MLSTVIDAAKALIGAAKTLNQLGDKRRARLASQFVKISTILETFVEDARQGKRTDGPCGRLAESALAIRKLSSRALEEDEVDRLANQLAHACENWQKVAPKGEPGLTPYDGYLREMEEAAGHFRGFADVLRAM